MGYLDIKYRICRVCKAQDDSDNMLKYDIRHYAHPTCFLDRFGADGLVDLPLCPLENFPKDVAEKRNVIGVLEDAIKAKRAVSRGA